MSHYTNRYNFWNDNKQKIALIDSKFSSYREFENSFFKNETNFYTFFNLMRDQFNFGQDLKDLYLIFACDFEWAKKTVYCGGSGVVTPSPNPSPNNDFPPCASKKGKVVKTPKGMDVIVYKTTVWDTPLVQLFAKSTRFMVLGGKHKGEMGNYRCLQNNRLFLELDSVKNAVLKNQTPKKDESKIISTTLTPEDLKNGRIVKLGMKGDIVGKIQELLISNGHKEISKDGKVDNIFGGRTKKMVKAFQSANGLEDDGAVGPLTWAKLSDPSLITKKSEYTGMGDDSPEFLQAQLDAQKSQLPVNHGKIEIDDGGNPFVFDGYKNGGTWVPQSEFLQSYNADGTKKLQENIIKNIVLKNLHSLL